MAREQAAEAEDRLWAACLPEAGDVLRPGAREGQTAHLRVVARTYTVHAAAQRLDLAVSALQPESLDLARQVAVAGKSRQLLTVWHRKFVGMTAGHFAQVIERVQARRQAQLAECKALLRRICQSTGHVKGFQPRLTVGQQVAKLQWGARLAEQA